jgi:hypothetical protein
MRLPPCVSHVERATKSADVADELPTTGLWKSRRLWKALSGRGGRFDLRRPGPDRNTLGASPLGLGGSVEIGRPERTYTVEPVEDPVPREAPAEPAEPDRPSPAEEPSEPEKAPAP